MPEVGDVKGAMGVNVEDQNQVVSNRQSVGGTSGKLKIGIFPTEIQEMLKDVDDGDGSLDKRELGDIFTMYGAMKAAQKEGSIPVQVLPKEIQPMLQVFDQDGSGTISPMELARAAELYQASKRQVRNLMKLTVALLIIMVIMLGCIAGLVFGIVEATKETQTSDSGVTYVKGSDTVASSAGVSKTSDLFDAVTATAATLSGIKSLTLSNNAGTKTYAYTITGFTKDATVGTVTFHSARGDKILVTGTNAIVTEACVPQNGAQTCTGRQLLELTKSGARRLQADGTPGATFTETTTGKQGGAEESLAAFEGEPCWYYRGSTMGVTEQKRRTTQR
jgi:hypothetical protein